MTLTSPNFRQVPKLWMTSSAKSECSESHTSPMVMICGAFISTRRIRIRSPQLLWKTWTGLAGWLPPSQPQVQPPWGSPWLTHRAIAQVPHGAGILQQLPKHAGGRLLSPLQHADGLVASGRGVEGGRGIIHPGFSRPHVSGTHPLPTPLIVGSRPAQPQYPPVKHRE